MKKIINYEKDIKFNNKIAFINSISIEDEYKVEEGKLNACFKISGDYKINELSVNNETFKYDLPLEYEFDDHVDLSTVRAEIENFEYENMEDTLKVVVDYKLSFDEKKAEEIILLPTEEELNEELDEPVKDEEIDYRDSLEEKYALQEVNEDFKEIKIEEIEEKEEDEVSVLKVHIYKIGETIESIAKLYNTDAELIKSYNDVSNLENKDKLIIPVLNE